MKALLALAPLLVAAWSPGCGPKPTPPSPPPAPRPVQDAAPSPVPTPVPPAPDDICESQCTRERELNCPEWRVGCADDCRKADSELAMLGSPPPNHACVAHSVSCEEMRKCR